MGIDFKTASISVIPGGLRDAVVLGTREDRAEQWPPTFEADPESTLGLWMKADEGAGISGVPARAEMDSGSASADKSQGVSSFIGETVGIVVRSPPGMTKMASWV